jgi:hypothetical protein
MGAAPQSDQGPGARREPESARRGRWFARERSNARAFDQEAEVRARLYARPEPTERTVELVDRERRLRDRRAA